MRVNQVRRENSNHLTVRPGLPCRFLFLPLLALTIVGCFESVPEGRILFKNDSMDWSYNVVVVRAGGASYSLKPGERALLPRGTKHISASRRYKDHTRFVSASPAALRRNFLA